MAPQQPAPRRARPVVIAELSDTELYNFLHTIRVTGSTHNNELSYLVTHNNDLSYLITSFWDLARVLNIEEWYQWSKNGAFMDGAFGIKEEQWKHMILRLCAVLDSGLQATDDARKSHKEAMNDPEPLLEKMVRTIPQDIMTLHQKAWKLFVNLFHPLNRRKQLLSLPTRAKVVERG